MCCGRNPKALQYNPNRAAAFPPPGNTGSQFGSVFQYLGRTALTVVGPVTGARYRFEHPGSQHRVDPRDRPGLLRVPVLKAVG
jgi:hypothetical protein